MFAGNQMRTSPSSTYPQPPPAPPTSMSTSTSAQATAASYARPKTRQRIHKPPEPLAVPDIDEDASERKRVLNVLAQRRYRERRRQTRKTRHSSQQPRSEDEQVAAAVAAVPGTATAENTGGPEEAVRPIVAETEEATTTNFTQAGSPSPSLVFGSFGLDWELGGSLSSSPWASSSGAISSLLGAEKDIQQQPVVSSSSSSSPSSSASGGASLAALFSTNIDPTLLFGGTAAGASSPPLASYSAASGPLTPSTSPDPGPDSYYLPVPELTLLRAALRIVTRLGCDPSTAFWDLNAKSPFYSGSAAGGSTTLATDAEKRDTAIALLPQSWRPTPAQRMLAHHPLIDVLPWPAAREKIIAVFNLPIEARPAAAADPLALVQFVYDVEDSSEGLRLWGSDPFDAGSWEVGQRVFERWWFVFDREIIEQSNRWRGARGAAYLQPAQGEGGTGDTSGSGSGVDVPGSDLGGGVSGSLWLDDLGHV